MNDPLVIRETGLFLRAGRFDYDLTYAGLIMDFFKWQEVPRAPDGF